MDCFPLRLQTKNKLVDDYLQGKNNELFHYNFKRTEDLRKRYDELLMREVPRKKLTRHIRKYMEKFSFSKEIEKSLKKLEDPNSVVVIGGQQAGLLTGPLYTIYKMISIVRLAENLERN